VILLALAALLLPGLAWWAWLGRRGEDPLVALSQIVGVGMAIIILVAQGGFLLGMSFSKITLIIFMAVFALLAADGLARQGVQLQRRYLPHMAVGLLLLGLAIGWRLLQVRDLLLPNWVDSQHHYLIIRAILEGGGLPQDLSPYLPMPFYYHYGFHAAAALFTAISGLAIGEAMLLLGQVLNALVGLSVYALGKSLWRNWRPALAAALLTVFATRMPGYYLSWGRYTLTTGLILLPLAMAQAYDLVWRKTRWQSAVTLAVLTAGLLLTHYFAALLLAAFMVLVVIVHLVHNRRRWPLAFMQISSLLNSAVLGLLLAAPWLLRVARFTRGSPGIEASIPENIEAALTSGSWGYHWQLLGPASNHWLLLPAGIGLLLALSRRHSHIFGLWSLTLALMSLPWGITLPPFRADHFVIVLFLPATLLVGWLTWRAGRWIGKQFSQRWAADLLLALMVLVFTAWGYPHMREIVNPTTVLVNQADMDALAWVEENTPSDARFYINTTYWMPSIHRGVDGGGWLLPYTGRWALVPTVFYGFSPDVAWAGELQAWGEAASRITTCSADFWALVDEAELDWIYLRTGVGSLQPAGLEGCKRIEPAFTTGTVSIYYIHRQ
jgi:hypothetical protein